MTERQKPIDALVGVMFRMAAPSDELRAAHAPKAILIAPGAVQPEPLQSQIQPLGLVRVGQLALVVGPAEFTTMSGRRIRETVAAELGDGVTQIVIAGYANSYAGYVTTKEEYDTQQYEGGHTLFGPWTLAGYQQEYARLAKALAAGAAVDAGPVPSTAWQQAEDHPLGVDVDAFPENASLGDALQMPMDRYRPGETAEVVLWTGNPNNAFVEAETYLTVERRDGDAWQPVASDRDWQTKCTWRVAEMADDETENGPLAVTLTWEIPDDTPAATYRLVHHGHRKLAADRDVEPFKAASDPFRVE
jgi:neutral ceramidase